MSFERLFITEKPSVATDIARWLSKTTGKPVQRQQGYLQVGQDVLAPMSGHLVEALEPHEYDPRYKVWRLADLPIIPPEIQVRVVEDKEGRARRAVDVIRKLLKHSKLVIGAGDIDAEGQFIQDELLDYLGNEKPVMRFWTNNLNEDSIFKAMANLRPNEEFRNHGMAARCRRDADWTYGLNATRAFTKSAEACGYDGLINLGRVQTPTLWLVVELELRRLSFTPTTFYVPQITTATQPQVKARWRPRLDAQGKADDDRLDVDGHMTSRADAEAIGRLVKANPQALVEEVSVAGVTKAPPLPFSLTTLQAHCSRRFKLTAAETLKIAQKLYLAHITTYPRVETKYLKESDHPLAPGLLQSHAGDHLPAEVQQALKGCRMGLKSKAWDDSKCDGHTAIAPAAIDDPSVLKTLSDIEMKVYLEILKRFILQFYPAAKMLVTKATLSVGDGAAKEHFTVAGKTIQDPGWMAAFESPGGDEDDNEELPETGMPAMTKGQVLPLHSFSLGEGKTEIPARYTDETLIMAMANIYKHVANPEYRARLKAKEGGGIGTPATRATTLEELVTNGYMTREGKVREFVPTSKAMELMQLIPEQLRLPDMTAMWQLLTDEIRAGRSTHESFMSKINAWVARIVQAAPSTFKPGQFGATGPAVAPDQVCFGQLGKPGCGSPLRVIRGVKGKYEAFMACTSESCGKTFNLREGKAIERAPRIEQPAEADRLSCPVCKKGQILRRQRGDGGVFWSCSAYREGCKAAYNDSEGKPDIEGSTKRQFEIDKTHSCPKCSGGYLQRRPRKAEKGGGYFWGCSAWKEGCKGIFSDRADGTPDLHTGRYTPGGAPRISARTGLAR